MARNDVSTALSRAVHAHDQVFACIDDLSIAVPNAFAHVLRHGGPLQTKCDGTVPQLKPGEWEIIRKLAQLGWAHFSVQNLAGQQDREESGG
jgi:hypothetical protein